MSQDFCKNINARSARKSKRVILLGASGSIGRSSIKFIESLADNNKDNLEINAISVHSSIDFLHEYLANKAKNISHVTISNPKFWHLLKYFVHKYPEINFYSGRDGLLEMISKAAEAGADTILLAMMGSDGTRVILKAIELGLKIILANKESLVLAGPVIQQAMEQARQQPRQQTGVQSSVKREAVLLPIDSEHNSLFRLLHGADQGSIKRMIITASGGALRDIESKDLLSVTKEMVLKHPSWNMGAKITVDSATMINKGLELIEAHYLFSCPYDTLEAWLHRASLVHAILELKDGTYSFHASASNMIFPIAHALYFPEALLFEPSSMLSPLDWQALSFQKISPERYPGFYLCKAAAKKGGTAPAILNAANEVAVNAFLADEIHFTKIIEIVQHVLDISNIEQSNSLDVFLEADKWGRSTAESYLKKIR